MPESLELANSRTPPPFDGCRLHFRWHPVALWRQSSSILTPLTVNFIIFLIVGGLAGWIASKIMGTDAQQGIILNVVVGIVGAVLAGWLISPLLGIADIRSGFSIGAFLVSIAGACLLLFLYKLVMGSRATA